MAKSEEWLQLLGSLMSRGVGVAQALDQLGGHPDELLAGLSSRIADSYRELGTLGACSGRYPEVFPEDLRLMMSEVSDEKAQGDLLLGFVAYRQKIGGTFQLLKTASVLDRLYLLAVFGFALVVLTVYGLFVFPSLHELYQATGSELPALTSTLAQVMSWSGVVGWLGLLVAAGVLVWWLQSRKWLGARESAEAPPWLLGIPFLGKRLRLLAAARAIGMFQTLVVHGVDVDRALALSRDYASARNGRLEYWLERALGGAWCDTLQFYQASDVLEEQVERVGTLVFDEIASRLMRHARLKSMLALVVLGVFVGAWVIAVYLPIFQLGSLMSTPAL